MSKYYDKDFNSLSNIDDIYKLKSHSVVKNYDINEFLDTKYYNVKETKITAKTHVYVRKAN